jgi:uncharacterized protein (TIGR02646 family)
LKTPLLALTWGKCAFCEGELGAQAYPQIEHYIARTVDPDRAFEWENLLPVCQICNRSKDQFDHNGSLLKPDIEDPEPFFWITPEGDLEPSPTLDERQTHRASETIRLCNLNRGGLRENRRQVADAVMRWLARTAGLDGIADQFAQDEWEELSNPRQRHKIVVRHALTLGESPELAALDREIYPRGR